MQHISPLTLTKSNDNQLREMFVAAARDLRDTQPNSPERTEVLWSMDVIAAAMYNRSR